MISKGTTIAVQRFGGYGHQGPRFSPRPRMAGAQQDGWREGVTDWPSIRGVLKRWQRADYVRLHAGEMTAQEMRSVLAVLKVVSLEIEAYLPPPENLNTGKPWSAMDLADLRNEIERKAPVARIARFLYRDVAEVEAKVREVEGLE